MIVFLWEISLETTASYFKELSQNKLLIMGKMLETESRDSVITMHRQVILHTQLRNIATHKL